jgi:nitrite reductase/ring-hydroxylating ferredoxin subunit/uncharacterized membrane protein
MEAGGEPARHVADVMHGTWLGHPVHPILTDFTIGAWGIGALFDAYALATGDEKQAKTGTQLAKVGLAFAVPTAITGTVDYAKVQRPAKKSATLHAALNDINFLMYMWSIRERSRGNFRRGATISLLGMGVVTAAAWVGGHLVYGHKVGVDHSEVYGPEDWTPAIEAGKVAEGSPTRVNVEGNDVLLFRFEGRLHAIAARCNHAGGPLDEGDIDGCEVRCPWHDSVFDLRDGRVIHGPAPRPQPKFGVRERDGMIEVRFEME